MSAEAWLWTSLQPENRLSPLHRSPMVVRRHPALTEQFQSEVEQLELVRDRCECLR
jgi:hypothetical protein